MKPKLTHYDSYLQECIGKTIERIYKRDDCARMYIEFTDNTLLFLEVLDSENKNSATDYMFCGTAVGDDSDTLRLAAGLNEDFIIISKSTA